MASSGINIFDRSLKALARMYTASFIQLVLPNAQVQLQGTPETVELSLPVRPVDFVQRVLHDDQEKLIHLEFQLQHELDFPGRICEYHGGLRQQFKLPVLSFAIYLRRRQKAIPNEYTEKVDDVVINRFSYPVVKLWDYADAIRRGEYPGLVPLLIMLVEEPTEQILTEERELILAEPDKQKQADLLSTAITIAAGYFDREFLMRFFQREIEIVKQASIIEDWLEESWEEGLEKGIEEERNRWLSTQKSVVISILCRLFSVPDDDIVQIDKQLSTILDPQLIKEAVDHALTMTTLADFQGWLTEKTTIHTAPSDAVRSNGTDVNGTNSSGTISTE